MADYDNTNSGVLFPVKEKRTEKAPDFTGSFNFGGKEVRLSAWKRKSQAGNMFLSIKVDDYQKKETAVKTVDIQEIDVDEIPF